MTNPFKAAQPQADRPIPPSGNSDEDKAARVRFWIERGNAQLAADGRYDLTWRHKDGQYWISPIEEAERDKLFAPAKPARIPNLKALTAGGAR